MDELEALEVMSEYCYAVQYNPNCPSPYLVRMGGRGAGYIDCVLPYSASSDVLGFGKTFAEASHMALEQYKNIKGEVLIERTKLPKEGK